MNAIDDNWEYVSGGWPYDVFRKGTNEKIADVWGDGIDDNHATADLIAAAPEMARLLLKMQHPTCQGDWCGGCSFCGWLKGDCGQDHKDDCVLAAVLRKVGVLP